MSCSHQLRTPAHQQSMCLQLNEGADSIIHLVRVVVAARLPGWPPCHPPHCSLHHPCSPRGPFHTPHPTPLHTPHTIHLRLSCSVLTCVSSPSSSYSSAATASSVLTLRGAGRSRRRQGSAVGLVICSHIQQHKQQSSHSLQRAKAMSGGRQRKEAQDRVQTFQPL